ncbi:MAG: hypothetical protein Q8Q85_06630, partial [Gemmatimonadales bacterium]|nr:hypothetical protein [Gemmatimonadales bacterium]
PPPTVNPDAMGAPWRRILQLTVNPGDWGTKLLPWPLNRPVSVGRVLQLASRLDVDLLFGLMLAPVPGQRDTYFVLDGQHRIAALMEWYKRHTGASLQLTVLVLGGERPSAALGRIIVKQNTQRPLCKADKLTALSGESAWLQEEVARGLPPRAIRASTSQLCWASILGGVLRGRSAIEAKTIHVWGLEEFYLLDGWLDPVNVNLDPGDVFEFISWWEPIARAWRSTYGTPVGSSVVGIAYGYIAWTAFHAKKSTAAEWQAQLSTKLVSPAVCDVRHATFGEPEFFRKFCIMVNDQVPPKKRLVLCGVHGFERRTPAALAALAPASA